MLSDFLAKSLKISIQILIGKNRIETSNMEAAENEIRNIKKRLYLPKYQRRTCAYSMHIPMCGNSLWWRSVQFHAAIRLRDE
jgi:hypothetical protein